MCRSIKQLRRPAEPPTEAEIAAAALQFVRKVSGYRAPSRANQAAFDQAVADIAHATQTLLAALPTPPARPAGEAHTHTHAHDAQPHTHPHPHAAG